MIRPEEIHTAIEDFYDQLEPPPEDPNTRLAEALAAVLECTEDNRRWSKSETITAEKLADSLASISRSYVAMLSVLRPDLLPGRGRLPHWRIAEGLGCTRQAFSRLTVQWSDRLGGLRAGGMKSRAAREQAAQTNRRGEVGQKWTRTTGTIGTVARDGFARAHERHGIEEAMRKFRDGRPWGATERGLLRRRGFIDSGDQLTEKGRKLLDEVGKAPA